MERKPKELPIDQLILKDLKCNIQRKGKDPLEYLVAVKGENGEYPQVHNGRLANNLKELVKFRRMSDSNASSEYIHPLVPADLILVG